MKFLYSLILVIESVSEQTSNSRLCETLYILRLNNPLISEHSLGWFWRILTLYNF